MTKHILCIDDEESIRLTFSSFLEDEGYQVATAASADEALEKLDKDHFDLIFLDILLGRHSGINVLRVIRKKKLHTPVIMVTGAPEVDTAADAVRLGAFDYISKPVRQETLVRLAKLAITHQELVAQKNRYQSHLEAIFRSIRDGLLTVDSNMRLVEINAAAKELLGIAGESIGENFELLDGTDGQCTRLLRQTLQTGQACETYRCECPLPRGGIQVLTLNTAPLRTQSGDHDGVVLLLRDETRMVKLERDLQDRNQPENMVGQCEGMQRLYSMIHSLASVDTTVLITGESGTGKELVAEALHNMGDRRKGPLVKFNCAALPENLLESELFGHVKGSFTGAVKDKVGRFQKADGGTIFLDEIGDISPATQVRLLRVLQDKTIEKVGGSTPIKVDVRIVAATNKDLLEKVSTGEFREDLYFRLNVMNLKLPALRQRGHDLDLLVRFFIQQFNLRFGKQVRGVSDDVMALFRSYSWPGNVRELEHALEHAFVLCNDSLITTEHLSTDLTRNAPSSSMTQTSSPAFRDDRQAILDALEQAGGNKTRAARLLGMSRRTIYRKINEYGI